MWFHQAERIVFDLDGTLVNSLELAVEAVRAGWELVGRPAPALEEIQAALGLPSELYWRQLLPAGDSFDRCRQLAKKREEELLLRGGAAFPGVVAALTRLAREGIPLWVLSNGGHDYIAAAVRGCGLESSVERCISAADDFDGDKAAALRAHIEPPSLARTIMVGDRHHDIGAAVAIGGLGVAAGYGFGTPEELAEADLLLHEPAEIGTRLGHRGRIFADLARWLRDRQATLGRSTVVCIQGQDSRSLAHFTQSLGHEITAQGGAVAGPAVRRLPQPGDIILIEGIHTPHLRHDAYLRLRQEGAPPPHPGPVPEVVLDVTDGEWPGVVEWRPGSGQRPTVSGRLLG